MRYITLFLLSTLWFGVFGQIDKSGETLTFTLPYQVSELKNGYRLVVLTAAEERTLRLVGADMDTLLHRISIREDINDLGFVVADIDSFFIVQYPHAGMKIYSKQSGAMISEGRFIEKDAVHDIVYFVDVKKENHLAVYDLKKKRIEWFEAPDNAGSSWYTRIGKKQIGDDYLIIWYILADNTLKKKYYARVKT